MVESMIQTTKGRLWAALKVVLGAVRGGLHRWNARWASLQWLLRIDDATMNRFLNSYVLFDGDWSNDNGKGEHNIVDYYTVLSRLCTLGSVEKMYIPPLLDPRGGVIANQELFERHMMCDIGIPPCSGSSRNKAVKVLDLGCGRGKIAADAAARAHGGVHVSGINIDPSQIAMALEFAAAAGLDRQTHFLQSSFNDPLPFADETFDAGYQVQAFTYVKDVDAVWREVFRVLKPGARFSYLDWVLLDKYDPCNEHHVDLVRRTMPFIGAVSSLRYQDIESAMKRAGFRVVFSRDASPGGRQSPLINRERRTFWWIRLFARALLPRKFLKLLRRLRENAEAFVAADELGIATSSYQIVCQKPIQGERDAE